MAASALRDENARKEFQDFNDDMEMEVKKRLMWSRNRWSEEGELDSRMHKLTNSLKYWGKKLTKAQGEKNGIFCLFNVDNDVNIALEDIFEEIDKLGCGMKMRGFTSFRNPKYLSIAFDTIETTKYIEKHLRRVGDKNVIFLSWAQDAGFNTLKLHWVPTDLPDKSMIKFLDRYVNIYEYVREDRVFTNGRVLKAGILSFKVKLKDGVTIESIPHLCEIDGNELLITVSGRKMLCLNCDLLGHRSVECPTPFCRACKSMQPRTHTCVKGGADRFSYAGALKDDTFNEQLEASKENDGNISVPKIIVKKEYNQNNGLKEKLSASEVTTKADGLPLNGKETIIENKSVFNVSGSWVAYGENVGDEDDDIEDSDSSESVVGIMKEYFEELNNLNANEIADKITYLKTELERKKEGSVKEEVMEVAASASKRKLDDSLKLGTIHNTRSGNRRTYSKRGGGGNKSFVSENLFDSLADKGGGKKK